MRFDLVTHGPDALFNIIAKQQRDQAVIEANDAERRQTAKRRDARSMAAAGTKPHGSAADEHDSRENTKAAGVKAERNRRYDKNECFVCGRDTSSGTAPKASRVRRGKASMTRATVRPPHSSSPQTVPTQHLAGLLAVSDASAAAEVKVLIDYGSSITAMWKELVQALRGQMGMTQTR